MQFIVFPRMSVRKRKSNKKKPKQRILKRIVFFLFGFFAMISYEVSSSSERWLGVGMMKEKNATK